MGEREIICGREGENVWAREKMCGREREPDNEREREFVIVRDRVGVKARGVKGIKCKSERECVHVETRKRAGLGMIESGSKILLDGE